jgi:uncharacterized protein YbjQ (UPF0145 family)
MDEADLVAVILQLLIPILLLGLTWWTGRRIDRRHLAALDARERALAGMVVSSLQRPLHVADAAVPSVLVTGEVCLATDYLKRFYASLRNLIGGEVNCFRLLLVRARREALVRMMEEAHRQGYDAVCNVRLESPDIGGNQSPQGTKMASLIAYGTAYRRRAGSGGA